MSKSKLHVRVPQNMERDIKEYQDRQDIEDTSEAMRQVLRRGLDYEPDNGPTPGERLLETATGVAGVAALGAAVVRPALAPVFGLAAFVLAILWAGIMVYAGRDLV